VREQGQSGDEVMSAGARQGNTDGGVRVSDLSPDQRVAYDAIVTWAEAAIDTTGYGGSPTLSLGGWAGCGKTVVTGLVGSLPQLHPIAFCAFTGKAASVLRGKLAHLKPRSTPYSEETAPGYDDEYTSYCGTVHALIFKPIVEKGVITGWGRRHNLDAPYKLIVVDEASQISDDLLLDLSSYNIPILAVGDHGQLPPVSGTGSLMQDPDIRLEKIHRQAEGNPIIALSKSIRETGRLDRRLQGEHIRFYRQSQLDSLLKTRYESATPIENMVTIVHANARRVATNARVRSITKRVGAPQVGDQVVCLKNVRGMPIYNGMRGRIATLKGRNPKFPWQLLANVNFEDGATFDALMCSVQFNREKTFAALPDVEDALFEVSKKRFRLFDWGQVGHLFDFGYAMTAWKVQGSQFEDVLAILERMPGTSESDWRRYCYTVVTRASERICIVEGP
jgi:exodeoxyribonuclease V